jgi:small subunit ribosomal protein S1
MMENSNEPSFADLLEESYVEPTKYDPGKKTIVPIVSIGEEWTFLNLGGKSEGFFSTSEIRDEEGNLEVKEGDSITVYFLSAESSGMKFTTKLGAGAEAQAHLQEAHHAGIPLEGTVEKEVKGGYEVKIAGSVRGFCPFSQAGLQRVESEDFVGSCISFKIIEYKEEGRNIILSRRVILEEEQRQKIEALRDTLEVGAVVNGTVTSIRNFGAFVKIDEGLEGLLPISEICWGRVEDINERLKVGQRVEVQVLKLDWDAERFSFSLKNAQPDPWENVAEKYPEGSIQQGKVARLLTFGAFVTLEEGIDGLLHISVLGAGRRLSHPKEAVKEGQELEVKIDKINIEEKRISLSPTEDLCPHLTGKKAVAPEKEDTQQKDYDSYVKEKKSQVKTTSGSLGTLGDLLKAKLGK